MNQSSLRTHLISLRNDLSSSQCLSNEQHAFAHFLSFLNTQTQSLNIAAFFAFQNELKTDLLLQHLLGTQHTVFLPVVSETEMGKMSFHHFANTEQLKPNRWGILEPINEAEIAAEALDIVITPLVGFDSLGSRIGMGGGFYDRAFAFRNNSSKQKPVLIGWAHSCQQVHKIQREEWDVTLDAVITEKGLQVFNQENASLAALI